MQARFFAKPLETLDPALSFPLVRLVEPALGLDEWRSFVAEIKAARHLGGPMRGGVIVVDKLDYVHGLFCYEAAPDLRSGSVLEVDRLIVVDNILDTGAAESLLSALETVAHTLFCEKIRISLPEAWLAAPQSANAISRLLTQAGYVHDAIAMVKTLKPFKSSGVSLGG